MNKVFSAVSLFGLLAGAICTAVLLIAATTPEPIARAAYVPIRIAPPVPTHSPGYDNLVKYVQYCAANIVLGFPRVSRTDSFIEAVARVNCRADALIWDEMSPLERIKLLRGIRYLVVV
jgi:hypothetical protein